MNVFLSSSTYTMTQDAIEKAVAIAQKQVSLHADYVEAEECTINFGEDINGEYITFRTSYCRSQKAAVCVVANNAADALGGYEM